MKKLNMFKSKIHRAIVTAPDLNYEGSVVAPYLNYEGSVTISKDLLDAADIMPYEEVHIWNLTNGKRFITYTLIGEPNTGIVCMNEAESHLMKKNDIVTILTFATMDEIDAKNYRPIVVLVDSNNKIGNDKHVERPYCTN
jgi:aspartate 1-decarboxylase